MVLPGAQCETERIELSQRERDWLKVWHEVEQKHLTQRDAAQRLMFLRNLPERVE